MPNTALLELVVVGSIFAVVFIALEIGYHIGRRTSRDKAPDTPHLGAVVGAMLGLVGLLLGFSFAGAVARYNDRQQMVVREASAIGTAYLRADMLDEPHRETLRRRLREYADSRVALAMARTPHAIAEAAQGSESHLTGIWDAARDGVRASPQFAMAVLPPVNEVIDLHTFHMVSIHRHMPPFATLILVLSVCISLAVMGYSAGISHKRNHAVTISLSILLGMTLWLIIDIDYPRRGLIRINDSPILDLPRSLKP